MKTSVCGYSQVDAPTSSWKSMRWLTPPKREVDALVLVTVGEHPVGDAGIEEQADAVAFEDAGAVRLFDLGAVADVDGDRVDAGEAEQVGEHQTGGAGPDDADGGRGNGARRHGVGFLLDVVTAVSRSDSRNTLRWRRASFLTEWRSSPVAGLP